MKTENINKHISVTLTPKEYEFIKTLAERDNQTVNQTLQNLFYLQLREEMEYFEECGY